MKCPLITAGFWADPGASGQNSIDCLKEECAWWSIAGSHCVIFEMAIDMNTLAEQLERLNDNPIRGK